jgi:hypothetical protein
MKLDLELSRSAQGQPWDDVWVGPIPRGLKNSRKTVTSRSLLNWRWELPTISRFYGIVIRMYFGDHVPPHLHAVYAEFEAVFDIRASAIIEGKLPDRATGLVLEWIELHRTELMEDWELCVQNHIPKKIHPLP